MPWWGCGTAWPVGTPCPGCFRDSDCLPQGWYRESTLPEHKRCIGARYCSSEAQGECAAMHGCAICVGTTSQQSLISRLPCPWDVCKQQVCSCIACMFLLGSAITLYPLVHFDGICTCMCLCWESQKGIAFTFKLSLCVLLPSMMLISFCRLINCRISSEMQASAESPFNCWCLPQSVSLLPSCVHMAALPSCRLSSALL